MDDDFDQSGCGDIKPIRLHGFLTNRISRLEWDILAINSVNCERFQLFLSL